MVRGIPYPMVKIGTSGKSRRERGQNRDLRAKAWGSSGFRSREPKMKDISDGRESRSERMGGSERMERGCFCMKG